MTAAPHALYAGSFDPLTLGHADLIGRGASIFPRLTVAIGINPDKNPLFTSEERLELMREVVRPWGNVEVCCFSGLTVDFARQIDARVLIRGVRSLSDIDTEFTMTLANHVLDPEIETVFLMASEKFTHISSSLIKQIALLGHGRIVARLREFLPESVIAPLLRKLHPDRDFSDEFSF